MIAILVALVLAVPPPADSLQRTRVTGALGARLDGQLTRYAAYGFSGTVLVVRQGQVVLCKGYGLADVERRIPNTAATRFEMNSMTKMFTGVAVLQLAAQGRLWLDDSVAKFFHDFPPAKQRATVAQLASHTSGLIVAGSDLAGDSRTAFVRDVARTPLEAPPGERYRYTNAGFSLLAAIIEIASGESYEHYLREHLFAPAGMRTARFRNEVPASDSLFAHGYVGSPKGLEPGPPNPYVWGTIGAGGVWCTVGDIYRWLLALESHRVLPEAQWRVLTSPPAPPAQEAFGWHVETVTGRDRYSKGGGSDDFASQFLYYPREGVVIVWASNVLRQRWRRTLNEALVHTTLEDAGVDSLPMPVPLSAAGPSARAGRYGFERDTLQLLAGPGYLYANPNSLGVLPDAMFFPGDSLHYTAFDPASGKQAHMSFESGDGTVTIELADGRRIRGRR